MLRFIKALLALLVLAGSLGTALADTDGGLTLADVQQLIKERNYSWTAGHTGVSELPAVLKRDLAGLVTPPDAALLEADIPVLTAPRDVVLTGGVCRSVDAK